MSKRSGVFASVWLALWTLGGFVALTQLWLVPEDATLAQKALLAALIVFFVLAWILSLRRLLRSVATSNDR